MEEGGGGGGEESDEWPVFRDLRLCSHLVIRTVMFS